MTVKFISSTMQNHFFFLHNGNYSISVTCVDNGTSYLDGTTWMNDCNRCYCVGGQNNCTLVNTLCNSSSGNHSIKDLQ